MGVTHHTLQDSELQNLARILCHHLMRVGILSFGKHSSEHLLHVHNHLQDSPELTRSHTMGYINQ